MTMTEIGQRLGLIQRDSSPNRPLWSFYEYNHEAHLPDSVDLREGGCVNQVKDQVSHEIFIITYRYWYEMKIWKRLITTYYVTTKLT